MPTTMKNVALYLGSAVVNAQMSATDFATFQAAGTNFWVNGVDAEITIPANTVTNLPEQHIPWSSVTRYTVA